MFIYVLYSIRYCSRSVLIYLKGDSICVGGVLSLDKSVKRNREKRIREFAVMVN